MSYLRRLAKLQEPFHKGEKITVDNIINMKEILKLIKVNGMKDINLEALGYVCNTYINCCLNIYADKEHPKFDLKDYLLSVFDIIKWGNHKFFDIIYKGFINSILDPSTQFEVVHDLVKYLNTLLNIRRPTVIDRYDLYKLMDSLCSCGDYNIQTHILEIIVRLTDITKETAKDFFPQQHLQEALLRVSKEKFEVDCRYFLNQINEISRNVFSIQSELVYVGEEVLIPPIEFQDPIISTRTWVDFNKSSKQITIICEVDTDDKTSILDSIQLSSEIVKKIDEKWEKEYPNHIYLIITLSSAIKFNFPEPAAKYAKARTVKILLKQDENTKILISSVLPEIFPVQYMNSQDSSISNVDTICDVLLNKKKTPSTNKICAKSCLSDKTGIISLSSKMSLEKILLGKTSLAIPNKSTNNVVGDETQFYTCDLIESDSIRKVECISSNSQQRDNDKKKPIKANLPKKKVKKIIRTSSTLESISEDTVMENILISSLELNDTEYNSFIINIPIESSPLYNIQIPQCSKEYIDEERNCGSETINMNEAIQCPEIDTCEALQGSANLEAISEIENNNSENTNEINTTDSRKLDKINRIIRISQDSNTNIFNNEIENDSANISLSQSEKLDEINRLLNVTTSDSQKMINKSKQQQDDRFDEVLQINTEIRNSNNTLISKTEKLKINSKMITRSSQKQNIRLDVLKVNDISNMIKLSNTPSMMDNESQKLLIHISAEEKNNNTYIISQKSIDSSQSKDLFSESNPQSCERLEIAQSLHNSSVQSSKNNAIEEVLNNSGSFINCGQKVSDEVINVKNVCSDSIAGDSNSSHTVCYDNDPLLQNDSDSSPSLHTICYDDDLLSQNTDAKEVLNNDNAESNKSHQNHDEEEESEPQSVPECLDIVVLNNDNAESNKTHQNHDQVESEPQSVTECLDIVLLNNDNAESNKTLQNHDKVESEPQSVPKCLDIVMELENKINPQSPSDNDASELETRTDPQSQPVPPEDIGIEISFTDNRTEKSDFDERSIYSKHSAISYKSAQFLQMFISKTKKVDTSVNKLPKVNKQENTFIKIYESSPQRKLCNLSNYYNALEDDNLKNNKENKKKNKRSLDKQNSDFKENEIYDSIDIKSNKKLKTKRTTLQKKKSINEIKKKNKKLQKCVVILKKEDFVENKIAASLASEVIDNNEISSEVTDDNKVSSKVTEDNKMASEIASEVSDDNKIASKVIDNNEIASKIIADNKISSEVIDENKMTSEVIDDNEIASEVFDDNKRVSKVFDDNEIASKVIADNKIVPTLPKCSEINEDIIENHNINSSESTVNDGVSKSKVIKNNIKSKPRLVNSKKTKIYINSSESTSELNTISIKKSIKDEVSKYQDIAVNNISSKPTNSKKNKKSNLQSSNINSSDSTLEVSTNFIKKTINGRVSTCNKIGTEVQIYLPDTTSKTNMESISKSINYNLLAYQDMVDKVTAKPTSPDTITNKELLQKSNEFSIDTNFTDLASQNNIEFENVLKLPDKTAFNSDLNNATNQGIKRKITTTNYKKQKKIKNNYIDTVFNEFGTIFGEHKLERSSNYNRIRSRNSSSRQYKKYKENYLFATNQQTCKIHVLQDVRIENSDEANHELENVTHVRNSDDFLKTSGKLKNTIRQLKQWVHVGISDFVKPNFNFSKWQRHSVKLVENLEDIYRFDCKKM